MDALASAISTLNINDFFADALHDLHSRQNQLTHTQFRWAQQTLQALSNLEQNAKAYCSILDETERNRAITQNTCLIAEPCLTVGNTAEEIFVSIKGRIEDVKEVYTYDKVNDNTLAFFRDAFTGLPCFNGRLLNIREYHQTQHLGIAFSSSSLLATSYDARSCELENIIYRWQECNQVEDLPTKSTLIAYIQECENFSIDEVFDSIFERTLEIIKGGDL